MRASKWLSLVERGEDATAKVTKVAIAVSGHNLRYKFGDDFDYPA